jgi:hypothetical protein
MTPEEEFGLRMFRYGYRGRDRWKQPLIALAILGDDDPEWRVSEYREGELESEPAYRFKAVKLLDLRPRMAELEAGENLFGLFIVAHLETISTKKKPEERALAKLRIMRNLLERKLPPVEEGRWARILDWLLRLPEEYNRALWEEIRRIRGGDAMHYVTPFERYEREASKAEGLAEGVQRSLRAVLKGRFKEQGEALAARVTARDAAWMEAAIERLAEADTLDKARTALELDP